MIAAYIRAEPNAAGHIGLTDTGMVTGRGNGCGNGCGNRLGSRFWGWVGALWRGTAWGGASWGMLAVWAAGVAVCCLRTLSFSKGKFCRSSVFGLACLGLDWERAPLDWDLGPLERDRVELLFRGCCQEFMRLCMESICLPMAVASPLRTWFCCRKASIRLIFVFR